VAANSSLRRALKRAFHPLLDQPAYRLVQALAKAWDIRSGNWTEPELDLLRLGVREGDTVLDIGANYGLYSYHFSRAVGTSGRVISFEPVPGTSATLGIVARLLSLGNVDIVTKGCGEETTRMVFEVPVQSSGAVAAGQAYIGRRNDNHPGKDEQVRWSGTEQVWCEVVRLDEFLPPLADLSFVKCDIEGAELFAFRGGEETISRHLPSVICEINPWFLEGFGIGLEELTGFFIDKGYRLFRYRESDGRKRLQSVRPDEILEDNYVFLHPRRIDRFSALLGRHEQEHRHENTRPWHRGEVPSE